MIFPANSEHPRHTQEQKNGALFEEAQSLFPGGVNSPVRAFRRVGGTPRFFESARGPWLHSADGRRYLDFNMSWGCLLHGHAWGPVVAALRRQAGRGTSFGAPTRQENRLGSIIRDRVPGLERLRFVSSGTEAVMSALRVARAATGRNLVVKFDGCYHGHSDCLLVAAGSGLAEASSPDSAGILKEAASSTISLPYNDSAAFAAFMETRGQLVAAVLVEPVAANMGLVPPIAGFLEGLRAACTRHGALLVFDEVITGFRLAPGGAQEAFGIRADIVCFGKIMGGGLPAAAFGGRSDLMNLLAPAGPVYQAGTLSGNPLAMVAGAAALEGAADQRFYAGLEDRAAGFEAQLAGSARAAGFHFVRVGSMFCLFATAGGAPPRNWQDVVACDSGKFARLFHAALNRGVYLSPSPFETCFVSAAHSARQLARAARALAQAMEASL